MRQKSNLIYTDSNVAFSNADHSRVGFGTCELRRLNRALGKIIELLPLLNEVLVESKI